MSLQPVDLPENALGLMKFSEAMAEYVREQIASAKETGRWEAAREFPIDLNDWDFWSYWLYKTCYPTERAIEGSGLEASLADFKKAKHEFLPQGFEIEKTLRLSAVGDLLKTPGLESAKDSLYEEVAEQIFAADIRYANLESTLSLEPVADIELNEGTTPDVNVNLCEYQTLVDHRGSKFDVLHLANNHILDCGEDGISVTLTQLEKDNIFHAGVNLSEEASHQAPIYERQGLRIGWVSHTYGVNFKPFPAGKPWMVNMTPFHIEDSPDLSAIQTQIEYCQAQACDLIIVALHWGLEFEMFPHPVQQQWARQFADMGADAVIGHHPHVAQPIELHTPDGFPGKTVPILYSLGNLTPVISHPAAVMSLIANMTIVQGKLDGKPHTCIAAIYSTPVMTVRENGGLRIKHLQALLQSYAENSYVQKAAHYADLVLGEDWRQL